MKSPNARNCKAYRSRLGNHGYRPLQVIVHDAVREPFKSLAAAIRIDDDEAIDSAVQQIKQPLGVRK